MLLKARFDGEFANHVALAALADRALAVVVFPQNHVESDILGHRTPFFADESAGNKITGLPPPDGY